MTPRERHAKYSDPALQAKLERIERELAEYLAHDNAPGARLRFLWKQRTWHDRWVDWLCHKLHLCDWACPYCARKAGQA